MSRKLRIVMAALAAVLLAGAPGAQAARQHRYHPAPCSLRGSSTVYDDGAVRVYRKEYEGGDLEKAFACHYAVNVRRQIAEDDFWSGGEFVDEIRVRGPWIAYSLVGGAKGQGTWGRVAVLNLRTGATRGAYTDDYSVLGLAVTRRGSLAWMDYHSEVGGYAYTVHKLDAGAAGAVVLDSGREIDPHSFAQGGRYVYWTKAGAPRSAVLR